MNPNCDQNPTKNYQSLRASSPTCYDFTNSRSFVFRKFAKRRTETTNKQITKAVFNICDWLRHLITMPLWLMYDIELRYQIADLQEISLVFWNTFKHRDFNQIAMIDHQLITLIRYNNADIVITEIIAVGKARVRVICWVRNSINIIGLYHQRGCRLWFDHDMRRLIEQFYYVIFWPSKVKQKLH